MPSGQYKRAKNNVPMTREELQKIIDDSGLNIFSIEKGVKMPNDTLRKALAGKVEANGYVRSVPTKWLPKILAYIKKKNQEKEELKEEVEVILKEHNLPTKKEIEIKEVGIPDEQRKLDWIAKLQEEKLNSVRVWFFSNDTSYDATEAGFKKYLKDEYPSLLPKGFVPELNEEEVTEEI